MSVVIRAMTVGLPYSALAPSQWDQVNNLFAKAEDFFSRADIDVRTKRVVLEPLSPENAVDSVHVRALLRSVQHHGEACGVRWFCLPFAAASVWPGEDIRELGPALVRENPSLFLHYMLPSDESVYGNASRVAALAIRNISRLSSNGFDNFRVGVGANIRPNTPFFPFSWHQGTPCFTFAVESLEPLLLIFDEWEGGNNQLPVTGMKQTLLSLCSTVDSIGHMLEMSTYFKYGGLDISIAPFPDERHSLVRLMEHMGLHIFGGLGTTSCTAYLTHLLHCVLKESAVRQAGFNGVMFSPLEDRGIAQRLRAGSISVESLMLWSTVCGCGVDMLPIEGATPIESLAALYQDVCTLSNRHSKPLGVRVLPVPGGWLNDETQFNHDFLVNCRIATLHGGLEKRGL
ncbi:MAG: DUF711 family protein [Desulfovibrionaceae bacterium]|nr:DUF711 family protein [Desulfovibrionaceae bacterium]